MIKTATQLKAKVRNLSGSDSKKAQTLIRNFIMERFLERIALSKYRDNFNGSMTGGWLDRHPPVLMFCAYPHPVISRFIVTICRRISSVILAGVFPAGAMGIPKRIVRGYRQRCLQSNSRGSLRWGGKIV